MRKYLFLVALFFVGSFLNAQTKQATVITRTGYINTETILNSLPEYKSATQTLESLSKEYKTKVDAEFAKIETLYNTYQQNKNQLSAQARQTKENEIITKERAAKNLQQSYFGEEGALAKKSEELLNPIREKVQKAIEKVAQNGNYMILFDIAAMQGGVAYANPSSDLSQIVIKELKGTK